MAEDIDRDAAIAACFDGFADCRDDCAANIRNIPATDAIDKLVIICNSLLSKYEEKAEAMIYEYSGNIDKDMDELHKEIEDCKAQINGVVEPPKEEI